jgi:hypothetical protein
LIEKYLNEELDEIMLFELMLYGIIDLQFEYHLFENMVVKKLQINNTNLLKSWFYIYLKNIE